MPDPSEPPPPRCRNLCCKAMMVYGEEFESDPEYAPGMTDFWCTLTARGRGPDAEHVSLEMCRNPERTCYQAF